VIARDPGTTTARSANHQRLIPTRSVNLAAHNVVTPLWRVLVSCRLPHHRAALHHRSSYTPPLPPTQLILTDTRHCAHRLQNAADLRRPPEIWSESPPVPQLPPAACESIMSFAHPTSCVYEHRRHACNAAPDVASIANDGATPGDNPVRHPRPQLASWKVDFIETRAADTGRSTYPRDTHTEADQHAFFDQESHAPGGGGRVGLGRANAPRV